VNFYPPSLLPKKKHSGKVELVRLAFRPMWSKLVSYLSLAGSRLWPPLLAASLAVGFTYLLKRRDELPELRKKLSAQLYILVRQQLSEAELAMLMHARAQSINAATWKNACTLTSGTGLRFIIELEKGKETAEIGKVLTVLNTLGVQLTLTPASAEAG
jgi:hypothetical protein